MFHVLPPAVAVAIRAVLRAAHLIGEIVVGLRELWDRGVVHRDVKADNLLLTVDGQPRIIDLGIARLLYLESLTYSLAPLGPCTPAYAAPEQLANRKSEINHRADQFALGIVFAQLLLRGEHPFSPVLVGEGDSTVENIVSGKWATDLLDGDQLAPVKPVVVKMLGHEPYQRFRRPDDLSTALTSIIQSLSNG